MISGPSSPGLTSLLVQFAKPNRDDVQFVLNVRCCTLHDEKVLAFGRNGIGTAGRVDEVGFEGQARRILKP